MVTALWPKFNKPSEDNEVLYSFHTKIVPTVQNLIMQNRLCSIKIIKAYQKQNDISNAK